MNKIKMLLVVLLAVFSMTAFASNERPLVKKPYYYTVSTSYSVCDLEDSNRPCWWVCTVTTYSVDQWNQVSMIGSSTTTSNSPGGCGSSPRSGVKYKNNKDAVRDAIFQQQRSLPGNENVVLRFLNL